MLIFEIQHWGLSFLKSCSVRQLKGIHLSWPEDAIRVPVCQWFALSVACWHLFEAVRLGLVFALQGLFGCTYLLIKLCDVAVAGAE